MARKPTGNPTGRPVREFDQKIFQNLCFVNCTVNEIECILNSDQRTIDNWCKRVYGEDFSTVYKRFSENGRCSVRRNQINLSKTNASMAIWLGKIMLGQKDVQEEVNTKRIAGALEKITQLKIISDNPDAVSETSNESV